jgi:hypothetical protein
MKILFNLEKELYLIEESHFVALWLWLLFKETFSYFPLQDQA